MSDFLLDFPGNLLNEAFGYQTAIVRQFSRFALDRALQFVKDAFRLNYTRRERALDIGPIHATADTQEHVPLPPIVGGLALAAGAALLALGAKQKA